MKEARLRALTPIFFPEPLASLPVEMKEARLRALTHYYSHYVSGFEIRRNERSPVKGIDTCPDRESRTSSGTVEMKEARLRALTLDKFKYYL